MAFPPAFLDELRFRVRLTDVIGRKVKLVRKGREWAACCPFHNEKTPSFYVNEDKGFYHCFGCGAHGDAIRFLTEAEGMGFLEAVQNLADLAGLEVPRETPEDREKAERVKGLHDVMELAASWFTEQLNGMNGGAARSYFERRGLSRETIQKFRLGFAPDSRTALRTALLSKGVSEQQLIDGGLLIQVDDKQPYDRFRGRVMFPIRDPKGRVIAFGGRVLDSGEPKYLNSPDTPLFDKGRSLFNYDIAAPLARKSAEIYVVEGYMDVIGLAQAGIENAVAPLGTALTEDQIKLLWRCAPEPLLCFDGDAAGQKASIRAAMRALPLLEPGKSLRFVTLPDKEDPDSIVRAKGRAGFEELKEEAEQLIRLLWNSEIVGIDMSTPERKAFTQKRILELAEQIYDPTIKAFYRSEFKSLLRNLFHGPLRSLSGNKREIFKAVILPSKGLLAANKRWGASEQIDPTVRSIFLTILRHSEILEETLDFFAEIPVGISDLELMRIEVIEQVIKYYNNHKIPITSTVLQDALVEKGHRHVIHTLEITDQMKFKFSRADAALDVARLGYHKLGSWLTQMIALKKDIVENRGDLDDNSYTKQQHYRMDWERMTQEWIDFIYEN
jgi:DNA primase